MSFFGNAFAKSLSRTKQQIVDRFDEIVASRRRAGAPLASGRRRDGRGARGAADFGRHRRRRDRAHHRRGAAPNRATAPACATSSSRRFAPSSRRSTRPVAGRRRRREVTLIVGVNGTGKTTTVGKLANLLKNEGRRPLICAADTFRAAAVEQLEIWARRAGVDMVRAREGADPAAVVFDAISSGKAKGRDPILVDTAGRLHTRVNLMNELEKIRRIASREVPGAPQEVLLVLDATVGQNGVTQAREFMGAAGVNGIVLTKLDGTAKGGVGGRDRPRPEAADPLRRRRRGHRRPRAVLGRRVRRRAVRGEVVNTDQQFMDRALFHAARGRGRTSPNPLVGAVVVVAGGRDRRSGLSRARGRAARGGPRAGRGGGAARAARRCTARSSRAVIRDAPVRASPGSSRRASRASSRPRRIRIRW